MLKNIMDIEKLARSDVQDFILGNKSVDIKALALKKLPFEDELRAQILQQISALQKAEKKMCEWTTRTRLIFPNADLVEQSSSDLTADYKASIYPQEDIQGDVFIDLCAGLGRDAYAFSKKFTKGYCVEADPVHAGCLEYNLKSSGVNNTTVINGYAEKVLNKLPNADLIYLDPQRRTDTGKRGLFDLSQTQPNVLDILPALKEKSPRILIKTSPYLDITEGLRQLGEVAEVHVVEAEGQCKEVIYYIDQTRKEHETQIIAVICETGQKISASLSDVKNGHSDISDPLEYLYEPSAALMKSTLHEVVAEEMGLLKIASHTHLYTSDTLIENYMGRRFKVEDVYPVKKGALPITQTNITTRNFPIKPDDLRKKLKLKDGGKNTVFACTLQNGEKQLILCQHA